MLAIEALDKVKSLIYDLLRIPSSNGSQPQIGQDPKDCIDQLTMSNLGKGRLTVPIVPRQIILVDLQQPIVQPFLCLGRQRFPEHIRRDSQCESLYHIFGDSNSRSITFECLRQVPFQRISDPYLCICPNIHPPDPHPSHYLIPSPMHP